MITSQSIIASADETRLYEWAETINKKTDKGAGNAADGYIDTVGNLEGVHMNERLANLSPRTDDTSTATVFPEATYRICDCVRTIAEELVIRLAGGPF